MNDRLIACELHDYVEIACLHRYEVKLTLTDNRCVRGKALDISTEPDKREYLLVENGAKQKIELTQIVTLETLTPGARFQHVRFK
ncbi:MAG: Rho-binding antiterminator [Methylomicrobium sp.]